MEDDVAWYEALRPCTVRARRWEEANELAQLAATQRVQVQSVEDGWLRLTAVEMWILCGREEGFAALEDAGVAALVPISGNKRPGGPWDQWAALLRWWPLQGLPPVAPATFGGAYLCTWQVGICIQARWSVPGEELHLVGPEETKASELCAWLARDVGLSSDHQVILVQDRGEVLPGDAKMIAGRRFCAMTMARPRFLTSLRMSLPMGTKLFSIYDAQAPQRLLVFFEELSQVTDTALAMIPGTTPLEGALREALTVTDRFMLAQHFRLHEGHEGLDSPALRVLANFGRRYHLELGYGMALYLAQDVSVLGRPVLALLQESGPPPLDIGLEITLEGLSGQQRVAAARSWTVGQLKDACGKRQELRLLLPSETTELHDSQQLLELLPEAMCTALTLRCVRLEPRWASAAAQLRTGGAWHELSEDMKADRDITLLAVQQEPSLLAECHHRSDAEVVLAAAQKDPSSLRLAAAELWEDDGFLERATALESKAVKLALEHREVSPELALKLVEQNSLALPLLPPELRSPQLLRAALAQDTTALQFADQATRDDATLLAELLKRDGRALRFASPRLRSQRDLVLMAIRNHPRAVLWASEEVLQDKEVLLLAMELEPQLVPQLASYAARI